jgi:mRNA-degrading endonuclease RelE of RelBE toxin-antitoxin system
MHQTGREGHSEHKKPPSSLPYTIEMTTSAEAVYRDLYKKSKVAQDLGHSESAHCKTFRMVEEAIKVIIPRSPVNPLYALKGHLSNIFRLRKGRMRITWIASSVKRRICILFISETLRKEGDAHDPYEEFQRMLESGYYDDALEELGVRRTKYK